MVIMNIHYTQVCAILGTNATKYNILKKIIIFRSVPAWLRKNGKRNGTSVNKKHWEFQLQLFYGFGSKVVEMSPESNVERYITFDKMLFII